MRTQVLLTIATAAILFGISLYQVNIRRQPAVEFSDKKVYKLFQEWMARHSVDYETPEELLYRLGVWYKNMLKIQKKNQRNSSHRLAMNQFGDLTIEEFKARHMGYKRASDQNTEVADLENVQAPPSWDWTKHGAVTKVKNQGACGSCWAFSATGAIEGAHYIKNQELVSFSEQYLVDCAHNGNFGCDGGFMTNAMDYVKQHGIPTEENYPYHATDQRCKKKIKGELYKIADYKVLKQNANEFVKGTYTTPVALGIEADEIMFYDSGVFDDEECGTEIDHGVLLVGYGSSEKGEPYWLVKNSWGPGWGENGYIKFKREMNKDVNVCGILTEGEIAFA